MFFDGEVVEENRFYVYVHRRKDNKQIFYVGKGTGDRYKREKRSKGWKTISNEAGGYIAEIYKDNLTETDALSLESLLITNPDCSWCLVNKVKSFRKLSFTQEEVADMFEYDETSETYLRYKKWNNSKIKKTARYAGDVAGYLSAGDKYSPDYYAVRLNGKASTVHRLVWILHNGSIPDGFVINHKNGNSLDNCIDNLEAVSQAVNCRRTSKQRRKGVGVRVMTIEGGYSYSVCSWSQDGKRIAKSFSHLEYGAEEAHKLATELRKSKIAEMAHLGYIVNIDENCN